MNILYDFPGYRLIEPTRRYYTDGDIFALPYEADPARRTARNADLFRFFTLGSVAAYAMEYGECPEAALADARERGHKLWWANQNATCISSPPPPQRTHPLHQWGDVIQFHGRRFRIDPAPNGNAKLVELEVVEV